MSDDRERCVLERSSRDEAQRDYEAAVKTGVNLETRGARMERAQDQLEQCLDGRAWERQMPWQTWGGGWEKQYG